MIKQVLGKLFSKDGLKVQITLCIFTIALMLLSMTFTAVMPR